MDKFLSSCPSYCIDSLDWTESEGQSQNFMSLVGDSQFPLSLPLCPDSQDIGVRCLRPCPVSPVNSLDSFEAAEFLDMERWDLADGEVISQTPGSLIHSQTVLCPPPSLDTQEFELRYMRSDDISPVKCIESSEKSPMPEMEYWDLANGEAISQYAVRTLGEAETPPCPPASLDSEEFVRRCVEHGDIMSLGPEENSEKSLPDALEVCALVDDMKVTLTKREEVSPMHSGQLSDLAPGEEISRMPVREFCLDSGKQPLLECSLTSQEFSSQWEAKKSMWAVDSITSADLSRDEKSRRSPSCHMRKSQSLRSAAYSHNSEVRTSNPATLLDSPLTTPTPNTEDSIIGHRSKRKNQEHALSRGEVLATTAKHCLKNNKTVLKRNAPVCRSPLRSISVNPRVISDAKDEVCHARQCHKLKVLMSEAEDCEDRALVGVPEVFSSRQEYLTGKENVEIQRKSKEVGATVSTATTILVKGEPKFIAGDESGSSSHIKNPFRSSKQVDIHDVRPESIIQLDTNKLDKRRSCSVQTHFSSRVGFTGYPAQLKSLMSEDYEQIQGWLCPKASKGLLSKKSRQRFLDTWLK